MNRFSHVLRRAEHRLEVPEPERSRILLEMAQDLEDLYAVYRERGLEEEEAMRRAETLLGASADAIEELERLHGSVYQRLLRRFSVSDRHRVEQTLLVALTVLSVAVGGYALASPGIFRSPAPLLWPLLLVAAASVWAATASALDLAAGPVPSRLEPRAGHSPLIALAALSTVAGGLGALLELWTLVGAAEETGRWEPGVVLRHLGSAAELLALALSLSLAVLLVWFQLHRRLATVRRARAEVEHVLGAPAQSGEIV